MYGNCEIICGCKGISLTCATTRAFNERYACFANDTRFMRTLTDSTTTMPKTKRLTVRELRNTAKELKNADLCVVQEAVVRKCKRCNMFTFSRIEKPCGVFCLEILS